MESLDELYRRLLSTKNRKGGYPLWVPEPNKTLPNAYCERGVSIGDVGLITDDGQFDYLFNICEDENHPVNGGPIVDESTSDVGIQNNLRTPPGFRPVVLNPATDLQEVEGVYPPGSDVSSTSATRKEIEVDAGVEDLR